MFKVTYMSKVLFWSTAHINSHFIQKKYSEQFSKIENTILRDIANHVNILLALIYISINKCTQTHWDPVQEQDTSDIVCQPRTITCVEYKGSGGDPEAAAQCFSAFKYYHQHNSKKSWARIFERD